MKRILLVGLAVVLSGACGVAEEQEYIEALPKQSALSMDVPQGGDPATGDGVVAGESANGPSVENGVSTDPNAGAQPTLSQAKLYQLTSEVSRDVNGSIWHALAVIKTITRYPASAVENNKAVWGPFGDALEPLRWVLTVDRKGVGRYAYILSTRLKGSTGEWTPIIAGTSKRFSSGFTGLFTMDSTALHELAPQQNEDTGKWAAVYDTRAGRRVVKLTLKGYTNDQGELSDAVYSYLRRADRSGEFRLVTKSDIHDGKSMAGVASKQEFFAVRSQWKPSGAGRGDAVITGGDIPSGEHVLLTECWNQGFLRVFYQDNRGINPPEGDAARCAFSRALPK